MFLLSLFLGNVVTGLNVHKGIMSKFYGFCVATSVANAARMQPSSAALQMKAVQKMHKFYLIPQYF
jgi:hypothetical protein